MGTTEVGESFEGDSFVAKDGIVRSSTIPLTSCPPPLPLNARSPIPLSPTSLPSRIVHYLSYPAG